MPTINFDYFFLLLYRLLFGSENQTFGESIAALWSSYLAISAYLTPPLLAVVFYIMIRIYQVKQDEHHIFGPLVHHVEETPKHEENERWVRVRGLAASENPSDWRLSIIEADVMLDQLLTAMGYIGDTLGEKLKGVRPADFASINSAWEAHKVRNEIAHSGSDFILTERETKRVISLYEQVFREFKYI